ncbi:MAG TPA: asparagine synthase (glutamine-hydrolyzing) [Gammaproteobacteria bacterium]|nr:asparagine synthase (glutamine-hydrolyzing) [Gammaproteobacteria bacterium]
MCGITGIVYRNDRAVNPTVLRGMMDRLIHRGPDDSGIWIERNVGLGHRRLSIRDLTVAGRQPMQDPSGQVVVSYNGEIYNDQELRAELERRHGAKFHTRTDTEILPLGYLVWGDGLFERLEGMFAIALWDRRQRRLVLARDGIGIKPLYYYADEKTILFGSELKALLAAGAIKPELDPAALHTFLATGFPGPGGSLVAGVRQVRPGTILSFAADEAQERVFWRPRRSADIVRLDDALDEMRDLLPEVVASQLVSDVPIGVLQSGGIDSSLVSLTTRRLTGDLPLFTASFSEASHDETALAAQVAGIAGLKHHVLRVEDDINPVETFRTMVRHFDGQCADTGAYAFYRLCGEVRKHTTVVLSGDGGDEFFAGYDTYRASQYARTLRPWLPASLLRVFGHFMYFRGARDESRLGTCAKLSRFALGLAAGDRHAHMQWRRLVPAFLLPRMYGTAMAPLLDVNAYGEYESSADDAPAESLDEWLLSDQRFHIQSILMKVDAMSMAHSLEVRVPLLDRRVMDFAGRCAADMLLPDKGPNKLLLRKLAGHLGAPPAVLRAGKMGFNVPIARMLRKELAPLADHWLEHNPDVLAPYLVPGEVRKMWREHKEARVNHAFALWPVLNMADWLGGNARSLGRIAA